MSRQIRTRKARSLRTRDELGRWEMLNDQGTAVSKHTLVRLTSTKEGGAYHKFKSAIADGTQNEAQLLVLWADSPDDTELATGSERFLLEDVDTSAAALGDLVYLSDSTAGAWTLTPTAEAIGRVTRVHASEGLIWVDPAWAKLAVLSTGLGKSRPDWDAAWENTISGGDGGDGDNSVYVNNSTGDDATADGTPDAPYATLDAAILDIPHNRDATALRNVTISVANTGTRYDISTHLEAVSQLTILCDLPSSPDASGTVASVTTTTTAAGMYFTTDLTYTGADTYRGWLIQYESGKWGWINYSVDDSGNDALYGTQAVNGSAYDTMTVSDTFDLYDPTSLVEIRCTNTGGNGVNLDQSDNLKIRRANITMAGSNGKVVVYQSRVTFQDCYFGSTVGRLFNNNGSMLLSNCYLACDGEAGFGMVGASGGGVLQLRGGTTLDGGLASTDSTPLVVSGSRVVFSGPVMFRGCSATFLKNGAEIDYSDGYNSEVSTYWWDMTGTEPFYRVTEYDSGTPVRGVIPDIHGDTRDSGTTHIVAAAPAQLRLGRGSSVQVTGKSNGPAVSLNNDVSDCAGLSGVESYIRWDKNTQTPGTLGTSWGPEEQAFAIADPNVYLNGLDGSAHVVDLESATGTVDWWNILNPLVGQWTTLEIINGNALTHSWKTPFVWAGGTAPTLTNTTGARDYLRFYHNGTDILGEVVALNVS